MRRCLVSDITSMHVCTRLGTTACSGPAIRSQEFAPSWSPHSLPCLALPASALPCCTKGCAMVSTPSSCLLHLDDSLHIGVSEPARAVLEQSSSNVAHYRPLKKPATEYGRLEERGRLCSIVIIEKQACDWRLQKGSCSRPAAISQQCRVVPEHFTFTAAKNTSVAFRG